MKKRIPTFTLVRKSETVKGTSSPRRAVAADKSTKLSAKTKVALTGINPLLRTAILTSTKSSSVKSGAHKASTKKAPRSPLEQIAHEMARQKNVKTVGILDMGAWLGKLPKLLETLNHSQSMLTFFEIQSPIPAGIINQKERVVEWIEAHNVKLALPDKADVSRNIIANEFFPYAEKVRCNLGLNYLIGVTPAMVAGSDNGTPFWNHLSIGSRRIILVSTADLREFAEKANRPYEVAVGVLLVSQMIQILSPKVGFHHPDTGCLFDYHDDRVSIVNTIRNPVIEASCLGNIPRSIRAASVALVDALANYR